MLKTMADIPFSLLVLYNGLRLYTAHFVQSSGDYRLFAYCAQWKNFQNSLLYYFIHTLADFFLFSFLPTTGNDVRPAISDHARAGNARVSSQSGAGNVPSENRSLF